MTRLYCEPCDLLYPPYHADWCPECFGDLREFVEPSPRFLGATLRNAVEGGEYMEAVVETAPAISTPALPVPNLRVRQAG